MPGENIATTADKGTVETSNTKVVERIYAAFLRRDIPGILENVSDDLRAFGIVSESAKDVPWHMQITSKKDVPKFFEALGAECEFARFEARDYAAAGDKVYCTLRYDVTLKRNGRKLTVDNAMHRFTLKGGKVIEWRGTEDTARIRDALTMKG